MKKKVTKSSSKTAKQHKTNYWAIGVLIFLAFAVLFTVMQAQSTQNVRSDAYIPGGKNIKRISPTIAKKVPTPVKKNVSPSISKKK